MYSIALIAGKFTKFGPSDLVELSNYTTPTKSQNISKN